MTLFVILKQATALICRCGRLHHIIIVVVVVVIIIIISLCPLQDKGISHDPPVSSVL